MSLMLRGRINAADSAAVTTAAGVAAVYVRIAAVDA
jgi:hypothetical protein